MNCQILVNIHLHQDRCENRHKLQNGIHGDKREQLMKSVAENDVLEMELLLVDYHPILYQQMVEFRL